MRRDASAADTATAAHIHCAASFSTCRYNWFWLKKTAPINHLHVDPVCTQCFYPRSPERIRVTCDCELLIAVAYRPMVSDRGVSRIHERGARLPLPSLPFHLLQSFFSPPSTPFPPTFLRSRLPWKHCKLPSGSPAIKRYSVHFGLKKCFC